MSGSWNQCDDFSFVRSCIIMLELAIRRMWPWGDAHDQQQYLKLWYSSSDWLVLISPKQMFPTLLHRRHKPYLLTHSSLGRVLMLLIPNTHLNIIVPEMNIPQARLEFYNLHLSSFGKPFCSWLTVFCCKPFPSKFNVLWIQICFSAHHSCTERVSNLL